MRLFLLDVLSPLVMVVAVVLNTLNLWSFNYGWMGCGKNG